MLIVISPRELNDSTVCIMLRLVPGTRNSERADSVCWYTRNVSLTSVLLLWCESGIFLSVLFQVTEAGTFKSHHFSVRHNTWPVVHSFQSSLNFEQILIQFNNLLTCDWVKLSSGHFSLLLNGLSFSGCLCRYFKAQRLFGVPSFLWKWLILSSW